LQNKFTKMPFFFRSAFVVFLWLRLNFWKFLAFSLKSAYLWPIIPVNECSHSWLD